MVTIQELRLELLRTKQFSKRELGQIRWLSPGLVKQRDVVMEALGPEHRLYSRMQRCGEIDDWNNVHYCGVPLCPRCFLVKRGKQTRQAINRTFAGIGNEKMAFLTVLLPVTSDLTEAGKSIEKEKRRLINFVARQRRQDARWCDFQMMSWWEMDRMKFFDYENCGRNTKLALDKLAFPAAAFGNPTIWRPHLHAIIEVGELADQDIAVALRADGHDAPYQVDIQRFTEKKKLEHNLQDLVRYSMKFRIEDAYKKADCGQEDDGSEPASRQWWPAEDIKDYAEWLCEKRSGFRSTRFVIGKRRAGRQAEASGTTARVKSTKTKLVVTQPSKGGRSSLQVAIENRSIVHDLCSVVEDEVWDDVNCKNDDGAFIKDTVVIDDEESVDGNRYKKQLLDTNWLHPEPHQDGIPSLLEGGSSVIQFRRFHPGKGEGADAGSRTGRTGRCSAVCFGAGERTG